MKKIFLSINLILLSFIVLGQTTSKGSMIVGTTTSFKHSTLTSDGGDDSESFIFLNGQCGYFFDDNVCGGGSINYMSVDAETITGIGLFGRYYFQQGTMYTHLGYETGDHVLYGIMPIRDYSGLTLGFGYCVWLGNNIAFEPSLMYTSMNSDGERLGSTFDVKLGFGLYF